MQVDYLILLVWTLLTLAAIVLISVLYRSVSKSTPRRETTGAESAELPKRFIFISAVVDEARSLLKTAREDFEAAMFNPAVEKSSRAAADVLSQLLRYFSVEKGSMSVGEMLQTLRSKGVKMRIPVELDRLKGIEGKAREGGVLTREEVLFAIQAASYIVEASKEAQVVE